LWTSYTLDPATRELFVPVGNPAPDWAPGRRPGANLFTDSALVLDANSGKLLWWYQLVFHDSHDYDLGAPPALYVDANGAPM
jgi:alcohol dehydrogenase (cytochrome c)